MPPLACPICERRFDPSGLRTLPFCSERCQRIDLRRWMVEGYAVPARAAGEDEADECLRPADSAPEGEA